MRPLSQRILNRCTEKAMSRLLFALTQMRTNRSTYAFQTCYKTWRWLLTAWDSKKSGSYIWLNNMKLCNCQPCSNNPTVHETVFQFTCVVQSLCLQWPLSAQTQIFPPRCLQILKTIINHSYSDIWFQCLPVFLWLLTKRPLFSLWR